MNKKNIILAAANPQSSQMVIWIVGFHREGKIGNTEKNHEAKMRPINKPRLRLVSALEIKAKPDIWKVTALIKQNSFSIKIHSHMYLGKTWVTHFFQKTTESYCHLQ